MSRRDNRWIRGLRGHHIVSVQASGSGTSDTLVVQERVLQADGEHLDEADKQATIQRGRSNTAGALGSSRTTSSSHRLSLPGGLIGGCPWRRCGKSRHEEC